jgi:DASH complex subunit DAD2
MAYSGRSLPSHLRSASASLGGASQSSQSPVLVARIAEKKAELANLKDLQALSAGLADQMQTLADKLTTLSDGTEGRRHLPFCLALVTNVDVFASSGSSGII